MAKTGGYEHEKENHFRDSFRDAGSVTLRFAWWGGDERNEATQAVIKQYKEAHPGVTIEAEPGSNDGYHDKLATQLASGTAPDIVQIDPETMPTFVDAGDYFVDLNTTSIDLSTFDADYISLRINGNYDGKQIGGPIFDDNGKLVATEDTFTKVFTYVKDLYESGAVAPASYQASYVGDDVQADANWIAGKYVAAPCYISTADVMVEANPNDEYVAGKTDLRGKRKGHTDRYRLHCHCNGGWRNTERQDFFFCRSKDHSV